MKYDVVDNSFKDLILNIKDIFNDEKNSIIFEQRNVLKVIDYKNNKFVVKSFKIPHLLNRVVYNFFRESKAKRSYDNSVKLMKLGVNTPKPIGFIEFNSLLLFNESFYVSEFFDYNFEIRAVFADKNFKDRENILKLFVEFSYELHNKNVYHIDYSPGNIIVKKIDDEYLFYIIDVNRMKFLDLDLDLRMKSFSKLTFDEDDNFLMVKHYAKISKNDEDILLEKLKLSLDEQRKYLDNKQKLKKLKKLK